MLPGWFEFPLSTGEDNETLQKASELFTSAINMVTTLNVEPLRTGYAVMNNLNKLKGDKGHMEVALPLEGKAAGKVVHVDRKLSNDAHERRARATSSRRISTASRTIRPSASCTASAATSAAERACSQEPHAG